MRRILLLNMALFLTFTFPVLHKTQTKDCEDKLPKPEDYPAAGSDCKRRVNVSPWVGTPAVEFTKTGQCVLSINTCKGGKCYKSGAREIGTDFCEDYWRVHRALANREICCDEKDDLPCTAPEPTSEGPNWFDTTYRCKELQSTTVTHRKVGARCEITYSACGTVVYTVLGVSGSAQLCENWANAHESTFPSRVCCDRWRQAVRPGSRCNPAADADCDGVLNVRDDYVDVPKTYETLPDGPIDQAPPGFNFGEISPTEPCEDCKWVLTKGKLNCSSAASQPHSYVATWKCPKTGIEMTTVKTAPATVPCK